MGNKDGFGVGPFGACVGVVGSGEGTGDGIDEGRGVESDEGLEEGFKVGSPGVGFHVG